VTWLLNTDADTVVPPDWALDHLRFAADGVVGVAGLADLDNVDHLSVHARREYANLMPERTTGDRHVNVYGANLGVRADAYLEHLAHTHLPCTLPGHLRRAGFRVTGRHMIPLFNPIFEQNTYSALTMETIARFAAGRQGVTEADVNAWMADLQERGAEDDYLFSVNRYCFLGVAE
jgi:hypothetical protein